jgi:Zn-dependent protease
VHIGQSDIVFFLCLIASVILHEISHGVVALVFGDDTAKRAGRLTLNPLPHIDPIGSLLLPGMMVLAGAPAFGWAKPVPVNPGRLRDPRRQLVWVGLVGPFTNFALMAIAAFAARTIARTSGGSFISGFEVHGSLPLVIAITLARVNLFLGVFNFLPIPPLDGSSLIERVLPRRWLPYWYRYRQFGFLVLIVAVFYFRLFGRIIGPFDNALLRFIGFR